MEDIVVTLSWAEIMLAAHVGCMRNVQSLRAEREPGNGIGIENTWSPNIEGACGEMALAKYLGVYWSGNIGNLKADDVGSYQVKTNMSRRLDDLILRDTDTTERFYVSVLSFLPRFIICGWIHGPDGKQGKWKREGSPGRPAFFVPRNVLHDIDTLPLRDVRPGAA